MSSAPNNDGNPKPKKARKVTGGKRKAPRKSAGKTQDASGPLTEKQSAFCREYLVDLNATQAAIRAGYSEATARSIAQENLTKPDIQREVQRLMRERANRVEVTADTVLRELLQIATVDFGEAFNEDGALKPIHEIPPAVRKAIAGVDVFEVFEGHGEDREQIGFTKKVRFWDKNKALELLGRHLKMFTDKHEHTGAVSVAGAVLTPEQIAQVERVKERRDALKGGSE